VRAGRSVELDVASVNERMLVVLVLSCLWLAVTAANLIDFTLRRRGHFFMEPRGGWFWAGAVWCVAILATSVLGLTGTQIAPWVVWMVMAPYLIANQLAAMLCRHVGAPPRIGADTGTWPL
jgi:hypothetical protein